MVKKRLKRDAQGKLRDYDKEYREYQGKPDQKKRRAERNAANRKAKRQGKIRKGDGQEVHHVGSHRTGSLKKVPTRVISQKKNARMQPKRK